MRCEKAEKTINAIWKEWDKILDVNPEYQRLGGIWEEEKKQKLIDSIINGMDIPKLYVHRLNKIDEFGHELAVVDGKQRIEAIRGFMDDEFPLASDFKYTGSNGHRVEPKAEPRAKQKFSETSGTYQEVFKELQITTVYVYTEDEKEIWELFQRLNSGAPLTPAELRNAIPGQMTELIREIAKHGFFEKHMRLKNKRYVYYSIAAKLLRLEEEELAIDKDLCSVGDKELDKMVRDNQSMEANKKQALLDRVTESLEYMEKLYTLASSALGSSTHGRSYPQIHYVFVKRIKREFGDHSNLDKLLSSFLGWFVAERNANKLKDEADKDPRLEKFKSLADSGTNSLRAMDGRCEIMRTLFSEWKPV